MRELSKLPLLFFFVASCVGLLLRWHFLNPINNFNYSFWLHTHSHAMFLGWAFNAIAVGFVTTFLTTSSKRYQRLFIMINLLVMGMLISFPLQGYGAYSIVLSTLHTVAVAVLSVWFYKETQHQRNNISIWFARTSLFFFLISAIGPFVVGALVAMGLGQSMWYYFSVYFYLHFQYNGVFTFGVWALFLGLLDKKEIIVDQVRLRQSGNLLLVACFPAYFLSTLWASPGIIFNVIGFFAALLQLLAGWYLFIVLKSISKLQWQKFSWQSRALLIFCFLAFAAKLVLQLVSAHHSVAVLAYEVRNYVIAYLHLVLIGFVSLFLLAWYNEKLLINIRWLYLLIILIAFTVSEVVMIAGAAVPGIFSSAIWLFAISCLLVVGVGGITIGGIRHT